MGAQVTFSTGAVRSADAEDVRYDLISPIAMESLAKTYAEGSAKYGDYNWERGMPVHDLLNHALRHIFKYLGGDRSEDHLGHAFWGLGASIHSAALWPDLNNGHLRSVGCGVPIHNEMRCDNGRKVNPLPEADYRKPVERPPAYKISNPKDQPCDVRPYSEAEFREDIKRSSHWGREPVPKEFACGRSSSPDRKGCGVSSVKDPGANGERLDDTRAVRDTRSVSGDGD